jgi:LCP family protein required for cell wall assembly
MTSAPPRTRSRRRSPAVAALLSLIFPGLGQAYAGAVTRGVLFALPMILLIIGVLLALMAGLDEVASALLRQEVLVGLLIGNLALFVYRLAAVIDAYLIARSTPTAVAQRPATGPVLGAGAVALVVLLIATTAMHGVAGVFGLSAALNVERIFHGGDPGDDWTLPEPGWATASPTPTVDVSPPPGASPTPVAVGTPTPAPSPSPTPFDGPPWAEDGRLNIVLIGSDDGPGRWSLRPDAIFLLSVEVETGRSAIFGFWRYMSNIPLPPESAEFYPNGRFPRHINALYVAAQDRPDRFPGNDARGLRVVAGAVQELAGVRVDHYVMVNLNGFVQVIDAMGGLWIDIPARVRDDRYPVETGRRRIELDFRRGCQHLDGRMALAYARTRHQDGDWSRMGRQQHVLAAMRRQFDPLAVLPRLPDLFDAAGDNLYWTLGPDDVVPIARLAARVDADRMQRVLFVPPDYPPELDDEIIDAIREKVRNIFDEPEPPPPSPRPDAEPCPPR